MAAGPEFSIGRIPVRVDPSFFMMALFIGWGSGRGAALLAIWVGVVFVSVLWHELGHAVACRRFGYEPTILLYAMGGVTMSLRSERRPWSDMFISLAGPGVGLAFGAAAYAFQQSGNPLLTHPNVAQAASDLVFANVAWGVLNLLPMLPLDGGQLMGSALDIATRGRGRTPTLVVSLITGAALAVAAVAFHRPLSALFVVFLSAANLKALRQPASPTSPPEPPTSPPTVSESSSKSTMTDPPASAEESMWASLLEGRNGDAVAIMESDPVPFGDPVLTAGAVTSAGGTAAALDLLRNAFESAPGDATGTHLSRALIEAGRTNDAVALMDGPRSQLVGVGTRSVVGAALFHAHRFEEAARMGETTFQMAPHPLLAYNVACAWVRHGSPDQALTWIERAVESGFTGLSQLDSDPDLASLRGTPRFEALRRRLGAADTEGGVHLVATKEAKAGRNGSGPSTGGTSSAGQRMWPVVRSSPVVVAILAVTWAVFAAQQLDHTLINRFDSLALAIAQGQWYRLFTPVFLHVDIVHIGFNSYALWLFGPTQERRLGPARFLALYVVAGFAGSALSYAFGGCFDSGVGASGAVFGVVGALVASAYATRAADPEGFRRTVISAALMLGIGFLLPRRIGNLAHIGGLVAGAGIAFGFGPIPGRRRSPAVQVVATVAVIAAAVGLVVWKTSMLTCPHLG